MEHLTVSVAKDFSKTPGPRYRYEGDFSGEEFRETKLEALFKQGMAENKKVVVNLDGTIGYGTSFLEEVFGGLARLYPIDEVKKIIEIISIEEDYLIKDIEGYINEARNEAA